MTAAIRSRAHKRFSLKRQHFAFPYLVFQIIFVVVPLFVLFFFAFRDENGSWTMAQIRKIFTGFYIKAFWESMWIGLVTTVLCLLIGYLIAYICSQKKYGMSRMVIYFFILPMWVNFVLRTLATRELFFFFDALEGYVPVIFGMVYNFLPFAILPMYNVLCGIDQNIIEAAHDLGGTPTGTFFRVILPLSKQGIMSAVLMTFMPTVSTIAISELMSQGKINMFGNAIDIAFQSGNYGLGAALSLFLFIIVAVVMAIATAIGGKGTVEKGGLL